MACGMCRMESAEKYIYRRKGKVRLGMHRQADKGSQRPTLRQIGTRIEAN